LLPDVIQKRSLCRYAMSVWLAVTFVYCVEMAKDTAIVVTECK